jgi:hypothetical protein
VYWQHVRTWQVAFSANNMSAKLAVVNDPGS